MQHSGGSSRCDIRNSCHTPSFCNWQRVPPAILDTSHTSYTSYSSYSSYSSYTSCSSYTSYSSYSITPLARHLSGPHCGVCTLVYSCHWHHLRILVKPPAECGQDKREAGTGKATPQQWRIERENCMFNHTNKHFKETSWQINKGCLLPELACTAG